MDTEHRGSIQETASTAKKWKRRGGNGFSSFLLDSHRGRRGCGRDDDDAELEDNDDDDDDDGDGFLAHHRESSRHLSRIYTRYIYTRSSQLPFVAKDRLRPSLCPSIFKLLFFAWF